MTTLNDLCDLAERSGNSTSPLRQACARPRTAADRSPLPEPHGEAPFDSSWDALLTDTPTAEQPAKAV